MMDYRQAIMRMSAAMAMGARWASAFARFMDITAGERRPNFKSFTFVKPG